VTAASLVGESLAAQGRLKVVRDVPLAPLIQASDVAVSSVSTALVEALLCGRPCFSADGLRMPHCRNPFTDLRGVGVVATPAEFVESVMRLLDGRRTTALLEGRWDASDFFHELDGQAAARAAAAIEAAATVGAGGAA